MSRRLGFFSVLVSILIFVGGCATNTKRIAEIDQSLQNRDALNDLCGRGATGACALMGRDTHGFQKLSVLQGVTSMNQSRFVVVGPKGKGFSFYVLGNDHPEKLADEIHEFGSSNAVTHQLEVFDLKPDRNYELLILGPDGQLWDRRTFKALDVKNKKARVAVVSCMDDNFDDVQKRIWPELLDRKPDAILLLGDNTYADLLAGLSRPITEAQQIWDRYAETRRRLALFKADVLVPIVAVWDDHDYGKNDGDRTFPLKEESTRVFFSFFPQQRPGPGFVRGPGVASWWTVFGVEVALLDDRSFRSPDQVDVKDQTHFGLEQETWLNERLSEAKGPVWLASGDQFFGGYHSFESFEGSHPKNFKAQLTSWRKAKAPPILFLSGDRHLSEIMKVPADNLGYVTYEITSSGIHAKVFDDAFKRAPSPLQIAGQAGAYNYAILTIEGSSRKKLNVHVVSYGLESKTLFEKDLEVKRP